MQIVHYKQLYRSFDRSVSVEDTYVSTAKRAENR